jgi:hypothetical protein
MDLTVNSQSSTPDEAISGEFPRQDKTVTITGAAALAKWSVLGRTHTTATDNNGTANAGNTGNGTIGTVSADDGAKKGTWRITMIEPATDLGRFTVEDPDGIEVGVGTVGTAFNGPINFTIADGATDFVAGDGFTVVVGEGTEVWKLSAIAAVDGSQVPAGILAEAVDVTAADKLAPIYVTGVFDPAALTYGTGHTAATVKADLEARNIYLKSTVAR